MTGASQPSRVNLVFDARPNYPYRDENAEVMGDRTVANLDVPATGGAPERVELARHHIVPWNMLARCWNRAVDGYYRDDATKPGPELVRYLRKMEGLARTLPWNPAPADLEQLTVFLRALRMKKIVHDPAGTEFRDQAYEFSQMLAWCGGNLVIGPSGANAPNRSRRVDDPGENYEEYLVRHVRLPEARTTLGQMRAAAGFVADRRANAAPPAPPAGAELAHVGGFFDKYATLYDTKWPQRVADKTWAVIASGDRFLSPGYATMEHNRATDPKLWGHNNLPYVLRQVRGRKTKVATGGTAARAEEFAPAPRAADTSCEATATADAGGGPIVITIGPTTVTLDLVNSWTDDSGCRQYIASVDDLDIGDLLDWAAQQWGARPEIPEQLRELRVREVRIETVRDRGSWVSWQFALTLGTELAGTDADIGVLLEYTGDNGLILGAHIGCRPRSDPDAHATYFSGTFARNGGGWQLDAEMIAGDPVRFGDLVHLLGVDGGSASASSTGTDEPTRGGEQSSEHAHAHARAET